MPTFLYGTYNEVIKKNKSICKAIYKTEDLYKLNILTLDQRSVCPEDVIVMTNSYPTRKIPNAFFPFVFSEELLFEESLKTSPLVSWYKEISLTQPWLLLSLVADTCSTQFLFDKLFSIRVLDTIALFWNELISPGKVYFNNLEYGKPLFFWQKNMYFLKLLAIAGIDKIDDESLSNFDVLWHSLKNSINTLQSNI